MLGEYRGEAFDVFLADKEYCSALLFKQRLGIFEFGVEGWRLRNTIAWSAVTETCCTPHTQALLTFHAVDDSAIRIFFTVGNSTAHLDLNLAHNQLVFDFKAALLRRNIAVTERPFIDDCDLDKPLPPLPSPSPDAELNDSDIYNDFGGLVAARRSFHVIRANRQSMPAETPTKLPRRRPKASMANFEPD